MNRSRPAPILCLFRRETHKIEVMLVKEIGRTVWTSRPCQRRDRVNDQVKIFTPARVASLSACPARKIAGNDGHCQKCSQHKNVPKITDSQAADRWEQPTKRHGCKA